MKLRRWWYCDTCEDLQDVIAVSEISEHGRKHREEENTRQVQKHVDTYA